MMFKEQSQQLALQSKDKESLLESHIVPLLSIPQLNQCAATFFTKGSRAALALSSSQLKNMFNTDLEGHVKSLLQSVVYGKEEKAKKILKETPWLLTLRTNVQDYSGRTIEATAFQAALGAEDERMWAMMIPFFNHLENVGEIKSAQDEMRAQFNEQFPYGIDDKPASELEPMYNNLACAIINDNRGSAAIEAFKVELTQNNRISSGKHFNMQHLLAAYVEYMRNYHRLSTSNNRDKFWQQVIGFVQRQMPANYAQAHCSSVTKIVDDPSNFKRTLDFSGGGCFFPVNKVGGLGFNFAVYSLHHKCSAVSVIHGGTTQMENHHGLEELCKVKRGALNRIRRSLEPASCCVIL